jgi:hypothetical protein
MFFIFNLQSISQAGRRGFDSRLPLHPLKKLGSPFKTLSFCAPRLTWRRPCRFEVGGDRYMISGGYEDRIVAKFSEFEDGPNRRAHEFPD